MDSDASIYGYAWQQEEEEEEAKNKSYSITDDRTAQLMAFLSNEIS